jgi:hypothetical protein
MATLTISLTDEQEQGLQAVAAKMGLELEVWAKEHLLLHVPIPDVQLLTEPAPTPALGKSGGVAPLPPAVSVREATQLVKTLAKVHPCFYLGVGTGLGLRVGDALGLCEHPQQMGRPCHWAPAAAVRDCPLCRLRTTP